MPYQKRFQKYEVGYKFIVIYQGIEVVYCINSIIPDKKRIWNKNHTAQYYRLYETVPSYNLHSINFLMSEDEIDRHKPCSEEEDDILERRYYAKIAMNKLLGIDCLYD